MKRRKLLSGRSPVNEARVDIIDHAFSVNSRGRLASAVLGLLSLQCLISVCNADSFTVVATPSNLVTTTKNNISLVCAASAKPILCLWKTPYGHIYTLSEGVFAESGRLRHLSSAPGSRGRSAGAGVMQCGLEIVGVESRDSGRWECEVGAVVNEDFRTKTDFISLDVKAATTSTSLTSTTSTLNRNAALGGTGQIAVQEVGDDVIMNCSADREVHLCRWKTPYLNTYIVGEGIYVERGRIAWKGSSADRDCTIQVSNLELRDSGTWVCEIGSDDPKTGFQVQTKEFQIQIETPLKLSAPTSLMQNANTDATLVCHANKPFDVCLWTTPYGTTYTFRRSGFGVDNLSKTYEEGRIGFFSFTDDDCGIVIRNVGIDDNGNWMCELHTNGAGNIFQNASDTVPLFTDSTRQAAQPRAIADADYGDYQSNNGFRDYNVDTLTEPTAQDSQSRPVSVLVQQDLPGTVRDIKRIGVTEATKARTKSTTRFRASTTTTTTTAATPTSSAAFFIPTSPDEDFTLSVPVIEISKISATSKAASASASTSPPSASFAPTVPSAPATTSAASPISIFRPTPKPKIRLSGVEPLELELLSRISGTRRASRPFNIDLGDDADDSEEGGSSTKAPKTFRIINNGGDRGSQSQREAMRLLEIQRIRDERKKKAQASSEAEAEVEAQAEAARIKKQREEERRQQELEQKRKELAEQRRRELEDRRRKEAKAKAEAEAKAAAEAKRQREAEERERKRKLEEAERERERERERRRQELAEQRRKELEERRRKEAEEQRLRELEEAKRREIEDRKRLEAEERKRAEELERKRQEERRRELQRVRDEEIARQKKLEEDRRRLEERRKTLAEQLRKEEEEKKKREEEEQRRADEEARRKKEEEAKRKAEIERLREEQEALARKEAEVKRELERQRQLAEEKRRVEEARRKEEQLRQIEAERKKKEEEDRKRRLENHRRREELERKRKEEAERKRREEEEKQKELEEKQRIEQELKRLEEFEKKRREEQIRQSLERIREEQRLEEERLKKEKEKEDLERQKKLEEEAAERERQRLKELQDEREKQRELERQRKAQQAEDERRRQQEREEREKQIREQLEKEKQALEKELKEKEERERRLRTEQERKLVVQPALTEDRPRALNTTSLIGGNVVNLSGGKECMIDTEPEHGNITCDGVTPGSYGEVYVQSGSRCFLECQNGYVSYDQRQSTCVRGIWSNRLECVRPDALIIVGGKSDTHGVLTTIELVTGRGVCRGAVPNLPAMRWRTITSTIGEDKLITCGGVNIFGDVKQECWILSFNPDPEWSPAPKMIVGRDAAAWAFEDDKLYVLGGSLGRTKGYTDAVEMFDANTGRWSEGPAMSSSRYSHCAVALGNGSLIITGGYGGLNVAERLDLDTGVSWPLPTLNPVRAQHGCVLATIKGEEGVMIVGGDSGGTRLKDVRFLSLQNPNEWRRIADINTARWGRPSMGVVGGRITVAAGWDGSRDLDTVEYYDEDQEKWVFTSSRLQTERRWASSTPISIRLFPKCVQRRG